MKYETPKLTALEPAINAIQGIKSSHPGDGPQSLDNVAAYEDWEE